MGDVRMQEGIRMSEEWMEKHFGWKIELNYLRVLAGSPEAGRSRKIVVVPPKPRVGLCRFSR